MMVNNTAPFWRDTLAYVGVWCLDAHGSLRFEGLVPDRPAVFAMVVDNMPVYVGLTGRALTERLDDFRATHSGQLSQSGKTKARVHQEIISVLGEGREVEVYVHSFRDVRDFAQNAWELRNNLRAAYVPDWNRAKAA